MNRSRHFVAAAAGCEEIARLTPYIKAALVAAGVSPHRVADAIVGDSLDALLKGDVAITNLFLVAHGTGSGLVQEGVPGTPTMQTMDPSWWRGPDLLRMCFLLGCYSAGAVPVYGIARRSRGTVAYRYEVLFYDGTSLGRKLTRKMVGAIVSSWVAHSNARDVVSALGQHYDAIASEARAPLWSEYFAFGREVERLVHLAIGLQMDGITEEFK